MKEEVKSGEPPRARRGRPEMSDAARHKMRAKIAKAADKLFQNSGYSAVSMRKIATAVGCTPMALYSYFPTKFEILQTLWGGVFEAVFAQTSVAESEKVPLKKLIAICEIYVTYWLTHPDHYRLVFMSEGVTQPDVSLFLDQPDILHRFAVFADAIAQANSRTLSPPESKLKLDLLLCLLHGIAHNTITISGYHWSSPRELIALGVTGIVKS